MSTKSIISIIFILASISILSIGLVKDFNFKTIYSDCHPEGALQGATEGSLANARTVLKPVERFFVPNRTQNDTFYTLPLEKSKPLPIRKSEISDIDIDAKAAIVLDVATDKILYNKNIGEKFPIASLTKLMTALIVLDEINLDDMVTISEEAIKTEGEKVNLIPKEKITAENLLYALLVASSNDAAMALAEYISNNFIINSFNPSDFFKEAKNKNNPQKTESIFRFVKLMNQKAQLIGLKNTHFSNPSGLDKEENYSTAYDLAHLTKYALERPLVWEILRIQETDISSFDGKIIHHLENTNQLLGKLPNIAGGKTGYTDKAGKCLILVVGDTADNHQIISVVLNAQDRFTETEKLVKWTFEAYSWQ